MIQKEHTAIDMAFMRRPSSVYVVCRHGQIRRCLSRDAANNKLAHIMTKEIHLRSGREFQLPSVREIRPEGELWLRGGYTKEYHYAHQRCIRRLRRILSQKREIRNWRKKYDAWAARHAELMKQKPF